MIADRIMLAVLTVAGVIYARSVHRQLVWLADNALNVERNCENGDVAIWHALDNGSRERHAEARENGSEGARS